jgi:hypothetical protein
MLAPTRRRPGSVVRATAQAIGAPTATPNTAAAQLTQIEFVIATAVVPVKTWRR